MAIVPEPSVPAEQGLAEAVIRAAETLDIGIAALDGELRFRWVNAAMAQVSGLPIADHLGRRLDDLAPDITKVVIETIRDVLETGRASEWVHLRTPNLADPGTPAQDVLASWRPLLLANGQTGVLAVALQGLGPLAARASGRTAELLERTERLRVLANQEAANARLLASLTSALGATTTAEGMADVVIDQAIVALDADGGGLWLLEDDHYVLTGRARLPEEARAAYGRVARFSGQPLSRAFGADQPVWIASAAEVAAARRTQGDEPVELTFESYAILPLRSHGRRIGTLMFAWNRSQDHSPSRRATLRTVGESCSQALERARLITELHRSSDRLALLADVSTAVEEGFTSAERLRSLARALVPRFADGCTVEALGADGRPRRLHARHRDAHIEELLRHPRARHPDPGTAEFAFERVLELGVPQVLDDVDRWMAERYGNDPEGIGATRREMVARLDVAALASVPITVEGQTIAALTLLRGRERGPFSDDDVTLAREIAARAAQALQFSDRFDAERTASLRLQRRLLPARLPQVDWLELGAAYVTAARGTAAGGDWYDAQLTGSGAVLVTVGDVVGHEIVAAATMGQLRAAIRAFADTDPTPAAVLRRATGYTSHLPDALCASVAAALLHERTLRLATAGHPPPVVARPGRPASLVTGVRGPLLGVGRDYAEVRLEVEPGSLVVLYTDGLVERRGHDLDARLAQLCQHVDALGDLPARQLSSQLIDALLEGEDPPDDIAVICARIRQQGR